MGPVDRFRVWRNRRVFNRLERSIAAEKDLDRQVELARVAAAFARQSGSGIFCSPAIEAAFLRRAAEIPAVAPGSVRPGTVLMVMSEAYFWGGHTRAVERWIEADRSRRHSVVVTRQRGDVEFPPRLKAAVEASGGTVETMRDTEDTATRVARLRALSSSFEFVVLHVHHDDPLPIMAYGTPAFTRPVGLYDHLDYSFWYGVSVAGGIGELREWGSALARSRRGTDVSTVLGIPGDSHPADLPDRAAARRELGFPENAKIVMSAGAVYKYRPMPGRDFLKLAVPLLESSPDVLVVGLGMTFDDFPRWRTVSERFGGRLKALGRMPHDRFMSCLAAADVVIDSWPVPGFTTLADAVACARPVLTCPTEAGLMDWMRGSAAECATPEELVRRARELLADRAAREACLADVVPRLEASRSPVEFVRRVNVFFGRMSAAGHAVHAFAPPSRPPDAFDAFLGRMEMFDFNELAVHWCRTLYGKWSWTTVSFACERHPWKTPWLIFRWMLKGCR